MEKQEIEQKIQEIEEKIKDLDKEKKKYQKDLKNQQSKLAKILRKENGLKINDLIDKLFETVDPKTTVVLIGKCYGERADHFEGYREEDSYNQKYIWPTDFIETSKCNNWCRTEKKLSDQTINALDELIALIEDTDRDYEMIDRYIDIYEGNECINEYWSGYMGITRDHKLISFVCRNDGTMLDIETEQNMPEPDFDFKTLLK